MSRIMGHKPVSRDRRRPSETRTSTLLSVLFSLFLFSLSAARTAIISDSISITCFHIVPSSADHHAYTSGAAPSNRTPTGIIRVYYNAGTGKSGTWLLL